MDEKPADNERILSELKKLNDPQRPTRQIVINLLLFLAAVAIFYFASNHLAVRP